MKLYFKHLLPSYSEWQQPPFAPWEFEEYCFLSILSFFESDLLELENFSLKKILQCEIFMDSGAFAAASMGFTLDPYEVAEMQALLGADLVVPLDLIIVADDSPKIINQKISTTIRNTEILLDFCSKDTIVGPLQGLTPDLIIRMFDAYKELGITKFALGGLVFQDNLTRTLKRIKETREITEGYFLHIFGKFLHPKLLKPIFKLADSVDGYGYILKSVKNMYIDLHDNNYRNIGNIQKLDGCSCNICSNHTILDLQRNDIEAHYLLIQHNIHALIEINNRLRKTYEGK